MEMSETNIEQYTEKIWETYTRMKGKKSRDELLDELIVITGWERKHANKVLLGLKCSRRWRARREAPPQYGVVMIEFLKICWLTIK